MPSEPEQRAAPRERRHSLRRVLVVPFVLQALLLAAMVVWLSYRTSARALGELTQRLMFDVVARIEQTTRQHIDDAVHIGQAIALGARRATPAGPDELESYLWQATTVSSAASYIYFGDPSGRFIGVERAAGTTPGSYVRAREAGDAGTLRTWLAAVPGDRSRPVAEQSVEYDPRVRPWYVGAHAARGPMWSDVYLSASKRIPVVTYGVPIDDASGAFAGVLGIDIALLQLDAFLRALDISRSGAAFIVDRRGDIIATSAPDGANSPHMPLLPDGRAPSPARALVERAAAHLRTLPRERIAGETTPGRFDDADGSVLVAARSIRAHGGLDWLLVVAAPRADFTGDIARDAWWTALAGALAVAAIVALGMGWLLIATRDLKRLDDAAADLVLGIAPRELPVKRRDELGNLARTFAATAARLQASAQTIRDKNEELESINASLERRVDERTASLAREVDERRRVERRLQAIADASPALIGYLDAGGRYAFVNRQYERWYGRRTDEIVGRHLAELLSPDAWARARGPFERALAGEEMTFDNDDAGRRVQVTFVPDVGPDGVRGVHVMAHDISERVREELRRSNEQLRAMNARLHDDVEAERKRIAHALHDEMGQELTALRMHLDRLMRQRPDDEALQRIAHELQGVLDSAATAMRRLVADLRPLILDDLGIAAATRALAKKVESASGIAIDVSVHGELTDLPDAQQTALYRCLQESLTNVVRHAQATEVEVELQREGGAVRLAVRDNGRGIAADAAERRDSYGLFGLRERAAQLGGQAHVLALPNRGGTLVEVVLPAPA